MNLLRLIGFGFFALFMLNSCVPTQSATPDPTFIVGQKWQWSVSDSGSPLQIYDVQVTSEPKIIIQSRPDFKIIDIWASGYTGTMIRSSAGFLIGISLNKTQAFNCTLSWDGKEWVGATKVVPVPAPSGTEIPYSGTCILRLK